MEIDSSFLAFPAPGSALRAAEDRLRPGPISPPLRNLDAIPRPCQESPTRAAERWTPAFAGEAMEEAAPEYIHNL
jgi:hypothetical protein